MSFAGLLNHKCDIYHLIRNDQSPGYGLPGSPVFSYPDEPDAVDVPCHFNVKDSGLTIMQNAPNASLEASIKLNLLLDVDVRVNDKIVDKDSGYQYTAEVPRNIRNHHQYVMLHRSASQEPI